jgi:hypothetical protein
MRKKNLAEVLQTDVTTNLPVAALAQIVRSKGRGRDTVLAHITPREARKLKREGGRGSINPDTGLPEFEDGFFDFFSGPTDYGSFVEPAAGEFTPYQSNEPQYIYNEPAGPAYEPSATGGATLGNYTPYDFPSYPQQGDVPTAYATLASDPTLTGSYTPTVAATPQLQPYQALAPQLNDYIARATGGEEGEGGRSQEEIDRIISGQEDALKRLSQLEQAKGTTTGEKSFFDKLTADPLKLALLLGAGGMGAYTSASARKQAGDVSGQIKALAQEQRTMAQPFLQQGGLQYGLATQGGLTPVNQQQFDVARARLAQEAARTGSVGAMQATQIAEQMRQQAINNQLTQALQILGSGNTVMNSAIANEINALNTRVSLTNQANTAAGNFFTQLAQLYGGSRA